MVGDGREARHGNGSLRFEIYRYIHLIDQV